MSDTQEESEEVMEVGYAEAAAYRDPMLPLLSSQEETDGETAGQEGHNVSRDGITLSALQSAIELVTSEARDDAQAQGAVHTPMHTDICSPTPEDAQAGTSAGPQPARENYLCIDGKERVQLEDSVEMRGVDFPQARGDEAQLQRNLVSALAACGYKCPVKSCSYKLAPRIGKIAKEHLEQDAAGHLLRLLDEPQVREEIFDHWELNHCPASALAQVKAQCPYFDGDSKGCASWLHPKPFDL